MLVKLVLSSILVAVALGKINSELIIVNKLSIVIVNNNKYTIIKNSNDNHIQP